ncbi:MAG TPA: hypothetical protein VIY86_01750, partial [Pirellulaceae bacterium]
VLVLVHAKRLYDSPLGKTNGWKKDQVKAFQSGADFIPATIERVLIASQLDLDNLQPVWKLSIFDAYGSQVNIPRLSERTGGNIEVLNGRNAVDLPNDTYVIQVDDTTIAAMSPANRQATARWLRAQGGSSLRMSSYLDRALRYADKQADVILALDLQDTTDPVELARKLKSLGTVKAADIQPAAEALADMQGLMLGITVSDKITGALRVDFASDSTVLKPYAKALLLEALSSRGVLIDDLQAWKIVHSDNNFVLSGPLSNYGFRETLSLVRHSIQQDLVFDSPGELDASPETNLATRSRQYFGKLEAVFDQLGRVRGRSLNTYAGFFERYAREIDEMSVVGIDPDLVKFGTYLSDSFRDVAGVLRDSQFNRRSLQAGMPDSYYREHYGVYGDYSYHTDNSQARQAVAVQQNVAGESEARNILRNVGKQLGEFRRGLSTKYQINF